MNSNWLESLSVLHKFILPPTEFTESQQQMIEIIIKQKKKYAATGTVGQSIILSKVIAQKILFYNWNLTSSSFIDD